MKLAHTAAFLAVVGLTMASGAIHGRFSDRWGISENNKIVARRMSEMPTSFGSWDLVTESELNEPSQRILEPFGYWGGTYANRDTGQQVSAFMLLGHPGRVAVHTPEICFASRQNKLLKSREARSIPNPVDPDSPHIFWRTMFKRTDVNGHVIPIYYAWSVGDTWSAAKHARFEFAGYPYLYKLQVMCTLPPSMLLPETDPCQDFLADFTTAAAPHLVVYDK